MNRRACLLDVGAENLAQRGVQQVGSGVIAADGVTAIAIDDSVDVVAHGERLFEHGLVGADALHRKNAAGYLSHGSVPVQSQKNAGVANLATGVAVEAGVIEHDFDFVACHCGGSTETVFHDGENFGVG